MDDLCQDDVLKTQLRICEETILTVCYGIRTAKREDLGREPAQPKGTCQTTPYPPQSAKISSTA